MKGIIDIWLDHLTFKTDELFAAVRALRARAEKAERERDQLRNTLQLHAGDVMSLSNEIDLLRSNAEDDIEHSRRKENEACAMLMQSRCEKCSGSGWLWAHEKSAYGIMTDDTRYSCDGNGCENAELIRARMDKK